MGVAKRGDLVTVATQGDFGKPRPALIIQSDLFSNMTSVCILPITSTLFDTPLLRINLTPSDLNGLKRKSQVMIDKPLTVLRDKIGVHIGTVDYETLQEVDRCLAVFLGIVK